MAKERLVQLPTLETMGQKFQESELGNRTREGEDVVRLFITSIADQEQGRTTIVAAWEQACEDANKGLDLVLELTIIRLLNAYLFDRVTNAVVPDPEVAHDAKEELQFLEEIRL